jgi:DNA-binding NarL/FixJ family response regulator
MSDPSAHARQVEIARRALRHFTHEERLVCVWKKAGFSNEEIASQLRTSEAEVQQLIRQAQEKLRRYIVGDDD